MNACGCWCWLLVFVLVLLLVVLVAVGDVIPTTTSTPPSKATHQQHHSNNKNSNLHVFSCMFEHRPCALPAQEVLRWSIVLVSVTMANNSSPIREEILLCAPLAVQ
jgi:uncharacterized protein (DUF305 family)